MSTTGRVSPPRRRTRSPVGGWERGRGRRAPVELDEAEDAEHAEDAEDLGRLGELRERLAVSGVILARELLLQVHDEEHGEAGEEVEEEPARAQVPAGAGGGEGEGAGGGEGGAGAGGDDGVDAGPRRRLRSMRRGSMMSVPSCR